MNCFHCGGDLGELTRRERDCADLLLEGFHEGDMAKKLDVSVRTIKQYMARLYQKYGIRGGVKYVKLAVALYYERHPDKRPRLHLVS